MSKDNPNIDPLNDQYVIHIQIEILYPGLTKRFTNIVTYKGFHYTL